MARIYVLNGGRVIERGTHAELMARGGQYAGLYTPQACQHGIGVAVGPAWRGWL